MDFFLDFPFFLSFFFFLLSFFVMEGCDSTDQMLVFLHANMLEDEGGYSGIHKRRMWLWVSALSDA